MKSSVSPIVVTVVLVVLIAFIGFLAVRNFGSTQASSNQPSFANFDPSKITPEQREQIKKNFEAARATRNTISTGH